MTPDWQAINAGPTPSLDEYAALEKADPNAFWRLDSGHHQNLLDAALAEVERLTRVLTDGGVMLAYDALLLTERAEKAEAAIARVRALCDDAEIAVDQGRAQGHVCGPDCHCDCLAVEDVRAAADTTRPLDGEGDDQ